MALPRRARRLPCVIVILLLVLLLATCVVAFDANRFPYENIDPRLLTLPAAMGTAAMAASDAHEGIVPTAATVAADAVSHHMFTGHAHPPAPPDSPAPSLVGGMALPPHRGRSQRPRMDRFLQHIFTLGVVDDDVDMPPSEHDAIPSAAPGSSPSVHTTPSVTETEVASQLPEIVQPPSQPPESPEGGAGPQWLTRDMLPRNGSIPGGARCPHPKCAGKSRVYENWREYYKHKKDHRERYQCRIKCDRWFGHESRRISHERSCANTREFACPSCGHCFNRKDIQKRHTEQHCVVLHQERMS